MVTPSEMIANQQPEPSKKHFCFTSLLPSNVRLKLKTSKLPCQFEAS